MTLDGVNRAITGRPGSLSGAFSLPAGTTRISLMLMMTLSNESLCLSVMESFRVPVDAAVLADPPSPPPPHPCISISAA
ncbi:MAG: hypothetical protein ACD_75C00193G0001, partial [uncultured bacterium]